MDAFNHDLKDGRDKKIKEIRIQEPVSVCFRILDPITKQFLPFIR